MNNIVTSTIFTFLSLLDAPGNAKFPFLPLASSTARGYFQHCKLSKNLIDLVHATADSLGTLVTGCMLSLLRMKIEHFPCDNSTCDRLHFHSGEENRLHRKQRAVPLTSDLCQPSPCFVPRPSYLFHALQNPLLVVWTPLISPLCHDVAEACKCLAIYLIACSLTRTVLLNLTVTQWPLHFCVLKATKQSIQGCRAVTMDLQLQWS